jgi:hypothetical protein
VIQGTFPWIFASLDAPVPRIGATFLDTRQLDKGASTVGASTAENQCLKWWLKPCLNMKQGGFKMIQFDSGLKQDHLRLVVVNSLTE